MVLMTERRYGGILVKIMNIVLLMLNKFDHRFKEGRYGKNHMI
jgi:hypothetical protein